ncbi:hypothetical protein OBBRIDRAFT_359297 [Obba rivulosa]|uniref:Uncharacterized protein n=1 Tax=Obba rivulosa TaxID=1052685 RepID=A0A8E2DUI3_9APHY|nr:hypothetical protein OBBRIDRAFT_359297 [Obba rivulosa]
MNRNFGPPGGSASNPSNGNPGNGGEGMDPNALASLIVELLSRSPQMSSNAQNAFGTMMPTPQQQPFMAQMSQASQIPRTSQMPQITPIPLQNVTANAVSQIGNILSAIRMGILSMPSQQQSVAAQSSSHPAGIVIPQTDGPVGIYHDDEQRLVQNLIEAEKRNVNHLQALEALHGVNNHSATAWKDYFIIHHKRLNELAANALSQSRLPPPSQSTSTANSASVGRLISIGSDSSLGRNGNIPSRTHELPRSTLPQPQRQPPPRSHQESRAVRVRRPTERARGQSDQDSRVYRSAERRPEREKKRSDDTRGAQIPDLPSRAPTPPTQVEPAYGGNRKFTEDDKKYFINFILWKTNHQPGITRDELCRLLGRKVNLLVFLAGILEQK